MAEQKTLPQLHNGVLEGGYKAVVMDLDGTLYNQTKLRLIMACRLGINYLLHPFHLKELLLLKTFRKVRDSWESCRNELAGAAEDAANLSIDEGQYRYVAQRHHVSPDMVERVVKRWIYDDPLDALKKCRREEIAAYIASLRENHIPVYIFSDYPIEDKLHALEMEADGMYAPGGMRNQELKPSPMGLELILSDHGLSSEDVLMVGDRDEKDGEAARRAGVDYVII